MQLHCTLTMVKPKVARPRLQTNGFSNCTLQSASDAAKKTGGQHLVKLNVTKVLWALRPLRLFTSQL
jgi:hypothetical protein